jgi:2-polyprenyl-3-methyl-5-hydroxy-6-metoxy-1,4-benzoquinol methylase
MNHFDEKTATADQLWDYYMLEYNNNNFIARMLFDYYYRQLGKMLQRLDARSRILEVGCGPGESSRRIVTMLDGKDFEASEFDERLVRKLLETNPAFKVSQESVYSLQRKDNEFDCVLLLEVLEHLDNPELALREIFRVARRHVIVSVPHEPIWSILNFVRGKYIRDFGNTPGHINRWSPGKIKKMVEKYGTIVDMHTPLPWVIILAESRK